MSTCPAVKEGDIVRAFHPRMFGVVKQGRVVSVGRKYVHVYFGGLLGGTFNVSKDHVVEVVSDPMSGRVNADPERGA